MIILRAERYVRQAHNLKVVGSNPTPATNHTNDFNKALEGLFFKYCYIRIKLSLRIFNLKHISQLVF